MNVETPENLLRAIQAQTRSGVPEHTLRAFEQRVGLQLPQPLRQFYRLTNGLFIEAIGFEILRLEDVEQYIRDFNQSGIPTFWGYVPFTDTNDANPVCVCCGPLLSGYLVRVYHDDSPQLIFRTVTTFFDALHEYAEAGRDNLPSEFMDPYRSEEDVRQAYSLIVHARSRTDDVQQDALCFALTLLSEHHLTDIAFILRESNEYVRAAAIDRLQMIGTGQAHEIIQVYREDFRQFVQQCTVALTRAGVHATIVQDHHIRLEPGAIWLNTEMLYSLRHRPESMNLLVEWAKTRIAQQSRMYQIREWVKTRIMHWR